MTIVVPFDRQQRGAPPGAADAVHEVTEAVRRAIASDYGYSAILDTARAANREAEFPLPGRLVVMVVDAAIAAGRRGGAR